jgi:hypothetical protein
VFIVAVGVVAGIAFRSAVLGVLAGGLLMASVGDFLFPVRFLLSTEAVEARGWCFRRRMRWSEVRRVRRDKEGIFLSPLVRHSRLDAYRGIYVWFEGNEQEVVGFVARHIPTEAAGGGDLAPV